MKSKVYSYELARDINLLLPKEIVDVLNKNGWNAFGIYELVKQKIKEENKK